jgi:hypothetical protein
MSEYEFLKLNPSFKAYRKMMSKNLHKNPKNTFKSCLNLDPSVSRNLLGLSKIKMTKQADYFEVNPIFKISDSNKISLLINPNIFTVDIVNTFKFSKLKVNIF